MTKLSTGLTLLAFATTLAFAAPAFAATTMSIQLGLGQNNGGQIDCRMTPADPRCRPGAHQQFQGGNGPGNGGQVNGGQGDNVGRGNGDNANNNGPHDNFTFSSNDRHRFHQNFGLSFGTFSAPGFSVNVGVAVPHSYSDLRPVPRKIYRAYPQFQGYLYFVSQRGDFVIVSPRSHRVIAVI